MAEVGGGEGGGRSRKGKSPKMKKKSSQVDMTAMVDVAFLLLTFFVLTATMTNSNLMELTMPPKQKEDIPEEDRIQKILEDKIMTLILAEDNKLQYYVGISEPDVEEADLSQNGLRKILLGHINKGLEVGAPLCKTVNNAKGCWDPIFVIKPKKESKYKTLIDVLDELAITEAPKYAITDFTPQDSLLIEQSLALAEEEGDE